MNQPLVTVIMPARNASQYIHEAITSVLAQSWKSWELLVINNASTDNTALIASSFNDPRVHVISEENIGITHARNKGLRHSRGEFFCFLDADDRFTPRSLECRVEMLLSDPGIEFADGWVEYWNNNFTGLSRICKPTLKGVPFLEVASLNSSCLCAVSWMFRKVPGKNYSFDQHWTHSEDIAFFLKISRTGRYDFVNEATYQVRRGHVSTMSNLHGLENGYHLLLDHIRTLDGITPSHYQMLRKKIRGIMTKTYLHKWKFLSAFRTWFRFSFSR